MFRSGRLGAIESEGAVLWRGEPDATVWIDLKLLNVLPSNYLSSCQSARGEDRAAAVWRFGGCLRWQPTPN